MCHLDVDDIVYSHHRLHTGWKEIGQMGHWRVIEANVQFATQTGHYPLQNDDVGQALGELFGIVKQLDVVWHRR